MSEADDDAYPSDEVEQRQRNKALNDTQKSVVWDMIPPAPQPVSQDNAERGVDHVEFATAQNTAHGGSAEANSNLDTQHSTNKSGSKLNSKRILAWLLPLVLIVAIGVAACFLFGGKSADDVAEEEEETPSVQQQKDGYQQHIPSLNNSQQPVPRQEEDSPKPQPTPSDDDLVDYVINGPGAPDGSGVPQQQMIKQ